MRHLRRTRTGTLGWLFLFTLMLGALACALRSAVPVQSCQDWDLRYVQDRGEICLDGAWTDACLLASLSGSRAQDLVDQFEEAWENRPTTRTGDQEALDWADRAGELVLRIEEAYGHQEVLSAVCEARGIRRGRLPEAWQGAGWEI